MHHKITHAMVGIVAISLVVAAVVFGVVVNAANRATGGTPVAVARPVIPSISHPVNESMADCVHCHVAAQGDMPPSHNTYGAGTCLTCHQVAPAGTELGADQAEQPSAGQKAAPVPHPAAEPYTDCVGCHAIGGNLSMPNNHASYANEACTGCHTGPAAEAAEGATPAVAGPPVPHDVGGQFVNCDSCHAFTMGQLAMPENHEGFTKEICTNCHQPAQ
jgi:hypothetical protein